MMKLCLPIRWASTGLVLLSFPTSPLSPQCTRSTDTSMAVVQRAGADVIASRSHGQFGKSMNSKFSHARLMVLRYAYVFQVRARL